MNMDQNPTILAKVAATTIPTILESVAPTSAPTTTSAIETTKAIDPESLPHNAIDLQQHFESKEDQFTTKITPTTCNI